MYPYVFGDVLFLFTVASNESPSTSGFAVPIKPKSSIKLKAKLKPIKPTAAIGRFVPT